MTTSAYLESPLRIGAILGSFAVLCIPLAVLQASMSSADTGAVGMATYAVLLGATHFVVTLGVYLNSDNLRYFASSQANAAIYFVIPAVFFGSFFAIGFFGLHDPSNASSGFLEYLFWFTVLVKAADYVHVVRQSFGVLQLFKRQSGCPFPAWMRTADNYFFLAMAGLQQLTFLEGMRGGDFTFRLSVPAVMLLGLAGLSFVGVCVGFLVARKRMPDSRALWVPLAYFTCQGVSACLPAWRSELYGASLAMHYVEYHLIMFPRLFRFPVSPTSRIDRLSAWFRRQKLLFYVVLILLACIAARDVVWPWLAGQVGPSRGLWLAFNLFNGVFVTHYYIDAFIWRFSNPYYRRSIGGLYVPERVNREHSGPVGASTLSAELPTR